MNKHTLDSGRSEAEYHMTYYSGGGTAYDGGCWILKFMPKSVKFTCIDKPFYEATMPYDITIKRDNSGKHCLKDWGDNSYTVYPYRNGTPHVFEPASLARQFSHDIDEEEL